MPRKKAEKPEVVEEKSEETMSTTPDEQEGAVLSDSDEKSSEGTEGEADGEEIPQTDLENMEDKVYPPEDALDHTRDSENQSQSDTEGDNSKAQVPGEGARHRRSTSSVRLGSSQVLAIDGHLVAETEAEKARNDLLDLMESQKTGRILTGTIQGVERQESGQNRSLAVIYHGEFKIIIPAEEAVEAPEDFRGRLPEDVLHDMLTKRLGAEVDYIVKGIDPQSGIAAASRLDAMRAKRKEYYLGTDRDGNYRIYSDLCAEARVVSVIRAGIFVDLFGLEVYIPLRELSYQRWMDAAMYFQSGQRILVKVLSVDRSDRNNIRVTASVKQAGENPYEKALRRYSVGNRYVGTVSMVDTNGVFVALDGGIDCLCSYPKRGRPPRGSRVTVRILGINNDSNRIWGAITHVAVPR